MSVDICYETVKIPKGETSADYMFIADNTDEVHFCVNVISNGEVYKFYTQSYDLALNNYANKFDITGINLQKRVEAIKGTITVPDCLKGYSNEISIEFRGYSSTLSTLAVLEPGKTSADFSLYADEFPTDSYDVGVYVDGYAPFWLHYDGADLSESENKRFAVNGEQAVINLNVPQPNIEFSGEIILPQAPDSYMNLALALDNRMYMHLNIPNDTKSFKYTAGFLTGEINKYMLSCAVLCGGAGSFTENLILYASPDGFTDNEAAASLFGLGSVKLDIDLAPFWCSRFVCGTVRLPDNAVPSEDTCYNVDVYAKNGSAGLKKCLVFNAGENEKRYTIGIPGVYSENEWQIFYNIGGVPEFPDAPKIPTVIIRDSDFSRKISSGGGSSGGYVKNPYNIIPDCVVKYGSVYYTPDSQTFDEYSTDISKINSADFLVLTNGTEFPVKIGGYFLTVTPGIDVTVQLINAQNGAIVQSFGFCASNESTEYLFTADGKGKYIIAVCYEGKQFYYTHENLLTENADEAYVIEPGNSSVMYGYNMYYNNIKEYRPISDDRYLDYRLLTRYPGMKVCLFDQSGNLICTSDKLSDTLYFGNRRVIVGVEYCGKYLYCVKDSSRMIRALYEYIQDAHPFLFPHNTDNGIVIQIDASRFTPSAEALRPGCGIKSVTYDYNTANNIKEITALHIEPEENLFNGENTVFAALYDRNGRLTAIKAVKQAENGEIELNMQLKPGEFVKIMGADAQMSPLFENIEISNNVF